MENTINIDNLRVFVNALNKLSTEVKNNEIDMQSTNKPFCGSVGCHAGLISIVADNIPKMQSLYFEDYDYDHNYNYNYDHSRWANTLGIFLGFDGRLSLGEWASYNPELWRNDYGLYMFGSGEAFGQGTHTFKHSVIIKHWTKVLERVEQLNDK